MYHLKLPHRTWAKILFTLLTLWLFTGVTETKVTLLVLCVSKIPSYFVVPELMRQQA